jgi:flagellar biosynthetic protein FlhB
MKGAIRERQRRMSRMRMMAEIASSDVVIVNPVHVAVALRYDPARGAPRVVAKGAGVVAARIREEADKHRIPMVEDIPLARTIYKACDLGQEVPADLYEAVARVLAFVFSLRASGLPAPRPASVGPRKVPTRARTPQIAR